MSMSIWLPRVCIFVYMSMSPWLRNLARYLSVCLYVYVALASHLGFVPVFSYVYDSVSLCPLGFKTRVCVYLCVFMFLPSWLRNVGVYLCVYISMAIWLRNLGVHPCATCLCPLGFETCVYLCVCMYVPLASQLGCVSVCL